ncbi:YHS domain-containing (seleno)protein [Paraferrimonas sedimenticola]|uniref:YHS domain-containing protein n=1 Tax=Paraferrimonas sedimenticola TaxID=375674 RepID=A0AA37RVF6_9GAMM|nr:YHS domain-containing (seleno)protein [Paraferrimonas sedimenticola]GLP95567.1 hypothetical protein GCM10007895_08730 [Paraferrimonas sedimenticola]
MTIWRLATVIFAALLISACTSLGDEPVFTEEGVANRGYDVVAYFTDGEPTLGDAAFTSQYQGVQWRFANAQHKAMFDAEPAKYAPEYGGYCAYAMSRGFVVSTDPQAWEIYNDKLYLNYSLGVRETWRKDKEGYVEKADANWVEKAAEVAAENKS